MSQLPFQLLELSIISAQDLAPVSKKLRTYAITWISPERRLRTQIDQHGQINPTWNDKFVFRVNDDFLNSDTSAVMIEIYASGWMRDVHVGSVRVLISSLIPPAVRERGGSSRRFVALQIRRPSGRPQGVLNMGVTLLDNTMRSMPLYTDLSASAVGFQDLMDVKIYKQRAHRKGREQKLGEKNNIGDANKIQLRRTQSDRTDLTTVEKVKNSGHNKDNGANNSSILNDGSVCNGSLVNGSVVNGSEIGGYTGSDIGPSASVVAAAVARGLVLTPLGVPRNPDSSVLGDWKTEESKVEGLRSKIERWRTELPPPLNLHNNYQIMTKTPQSRHSKRQTDEGGDGGDGLFSCFGKVCGYEFTIVCGGNKQR